MFHYPYCHLADACFGNGMHWCDTPELSEVVTLLEDSVLALAAPIVACSDCQPVSRTKGDALPAKSRLDNCTACAESTCTCST